NMNVQREQREPKRDRLKKPVQERPPSNDGEMTRRPQDAQSLRDPTEHLAAAGLDGRRYSASGQFEQSNECFRKEHQRIKADQESNRASDDQPCRVVERVADDARISLQLA